MTKITFKNLPDTSTPLSANNLNTLQDNVENAISAAVSTVEGEIPTVDSSTSTSSTNPVENQAITNYVNGKISNTAGTSQTIGYSQEYVNNYVPFKLWTTETGDTLISLPTTWNEILIVCTNLYDAFRCMTYTIVYGMPTGQYLRLSYFGDASTDNANVGYLYGSSNDIKLIWYNIGGAGQTLADVQTQIYYR